MIAFRDNLPLLERPRGIVTAFNGSWLRQALSRAAQKAGYTEWWLADDLTRSVVFYLQFHYPDNTIAVPRLKDVVRSALRQIGYDEIARHFGARTPLRKISLPDLVTSGEKPGIEEFFHQLARRIRSLQPEGSEIVHFSGLAECACCLQDRGDLFAQEFFSCQLLEAEVVNFIRSELAALGWKHVRFSIS